MSRGFFLLWLNIATLAGSIVVWVLAVPFGWLESVSFVSHISMAALVLSSLAGIAAADAALESEAPKEE
jgi:hypothetical protein